MSDNMQKTVDVQSQKAASSLSLSAHQANEIRLDYFFYGEQWWLDDNDNSAIMFELDGEVTTGLFATDAMIIEHSTTVSIHYILLIL